MDAVSLGDTLVTEKDIEEALEREAETIIATDLGPLQNHRRVVNDSANSPEDTRVSSTQDRPPSEQVITTDQRIWSEGARHAHCISTLHQQAQVEHARDTTKGQTFHSRLVELANKPRKRLRNSPSKSLANHKNIKTVRNNIGQDGTKQLGSNIARWLDGLRSISSISEFWGSSDESSSVEVVAAKDAKGRGKGMRIVSDGVEETPLPGEVFSNMFRAEKAKSN